ncbi:MAG: prepilin-type N-terminal cleavage/methylation domain-containing protein [Candidatus Brocadiia bacterium]
MIWPTRDNRAGFTLIELLLVSALLGVAAAVVAPRVGALLPVMRLRDAGRQVADTLRTARARAADAGRAVAVEYDLTEGTVRVLSASEQPEEERPPDPLPVDVSIVAVYLPETSPLTSGTARVSVLPSGYVSPHSVELGDGRRRVVVESQFLRTVVRDAR